MKVDELQVDKRIIAVLKEQGVQELYPPQAEAVGPALAGKNLVLAIPTASGKSLVGYLAILKKVLAGGKALYIVPLKALASEKYEDLLELGRAVGLRVAISTGDFDTGGDYLSKFDIVVATSEKADSLMRHKSSWLEALNILVADEIHNVGDIGRGPTLEVVLTRFRYINPSAQIVALSATVPNADELAKWLDAEVIVSEWRPVVLKKGVFRADRGQLEFSDGSGRQLAIAQRPSIPLVLDTISRKGQVLVFVQDRRGTQAEAKELSKVVSKLLTPDERAALNIVANKLEAGAAEGTKTLTLLADLVRQGVAFHHAGLSTDMRKEVERGFKERKIKVITSTPTLAAGINLPARMVIIRDFRRYEEGSGRVPLRVSEILQMMGRAGRPGLDPDGEAVIIASDDREYYFVTERYLNGHPEDVHSHLGEGPALRAHVLSSVAAEFTPTVQDLETFFKSTLYGAQVAGAALESKFLELLGETRDLLIGFDMINVQGVKLTATKYGQRVSQLYIDPLGAETIREGLQVAAKKGKATMFAYLDLFAATSDLRQLLLYLKTNDVATYGPLFDSRLEELILPPDLISFAVDQGDMAEYEERVKEVKFARLLEEWCDEIPEDLIEEEYGNVSSGDIRTRVDRTEWMAYCAFEINKLFKLGLQKDLDMVRRRLGDGVKEELIPLVKLRGVGRVRARNLFNAGFTSLDLIAKATAAELSKVKKIGPETARKILDQLKPETRKEVEERRPEEEDEPPEKEIGLEWGKGKSYFD